MLDKRNYVTPDEDPHVRVPSEPRITIERNGGMWHWELTWMPPCTRRKGGPPRPDRQIPREQSDCALTQRGARRAAERAWRRVLREHDNHMARITYTPEMSA